MTTGALAALEQGCTPRCGFVADFRCYHSGKRPQTDGEMVGCGGGGSTFRQMISGFLAKPPG